MRSMKNNHCNTQYSKKGSRLRQSARDHLGKCVGLGHTLGETRGYSFFRISSTTTCRPQVAVYLCVYQDVKLKLSTVMQHI